MRSIKFRAWDGDSFKPIEDDGDYYFRDYGEGLELHDKFGPCRNVTLLQFTGLLDKNGKEIYEGDVIRWRNPVRTTQTHEGDNIPNGSYTEPMEPGIITHEEEVQFKDGCFVYEDDKHGFVPINWLNLSYDLDGIKEAISYGRPDRFLWDDPEEGDLQYLMEECAKVKNPEELVEYLSGVTVIGNVYENSELIV